MSKTTKEQMNKNEARLKTAKSYAENAFLLSAERKDISEEFVRQNSATFLKLLKALPQSLQIFNSLVEKIISEYDDSNESKYPVTWLGQNLKRINTGGVCIITVSQCWEHEYDFVNLCELFISGIDLS